MITIRFRTRRRHRRFSDPVFIGRHYDIDTGILRDSRTGEILSEPDYTGADDEAYVVTIDADAPAGVGGITRETLQDAIRIMGRQSARPMEIFTYRVDGGP